MRWMSTVWQNEQVEACYSQAGYFRTKERKRGNTADALPLFRKLFTKTSCTIWVFKRNCCRMGGTLNIYKYLLQGKVVPRRENTLSSCDMLQTFRLYKKTHQNNVRETEVMLCESYQARRHLGRSIKKQLHVITWRSTPRVLPGNWQACLPGKFYPDRFLKTRFLLQCICHALKNGWFHI